MENETDFFSAPASAKTHGAYEGGLLIHSLSVYKILQNFSKNIPNVKKEAVIISALLHDLCKVNFYVKGVRNVKIPGERRWEEVEVYNIEDTPVSYTHLVNIIKIRKTSIVQKYERSI